MDTFDNQKNNFFSFLDKFDENELIGIVAHAKCNDGMISSIFLNEILKNKFPKMKKPITLFKDYKLNLFEDLTNYFRKENVTKVFILDISINSETFKGLENFSKDFDICYIDHHPSDSEVKFLKYIVKTESADCTSLNLYKLGQPFLNKPYFNELLCAVLISEFSYVKIDNLKVLQQFYPKINLKNINLSEPFKLSNSIGSVVIYYKDDTSKAYELILNRATSKINEIDSLVSAEVEEHLKKFKEINSHSKEKILFYEFNSKFSIGSRISTILSTKNKSKIIIIYSLSDSNPYLIKVSARCQIEKLPFSMSNLLKAGITNLNGATVGGHPRASGGSFLKKDLEIFKKQVISYVKSRAN